MFTQRNILLNLRENHFFGKISQCSKHFSVWGHGFFGPFSSSDFFKNKLLFLLQKKVFFLQNIFFPEYLTGKKKLVLIKFWNFFQKINIKN
jgi:hypothetical protein